MEKLFLGLLFSCLICGCNHMEVNPGAIEHIPFSNNIAIGTDSTIVIVNRESGKILSTINRHK